MNEGIKNPTRLFQGIGGTYWAWGVDGYYDVHLTDGETPDGSDVIIEDFHLTVEAARRAARGYDAVLRMV